MGYARYKGCLLVRLFNKHKIPVLSWYYFDAFIVVQALRFNVYYEFSPYIWLAFDIYRASHLFDDLLADRESKPRARLVSILVIFKLAKVNEQVLDSF